MNYVIRTTTVVFSLMLAGYATAANELNRHDVFGLMQSGYISVGNLSTPEEIATALKDKAEQAGASHFRITSLGGNNKLYGTAIIYR
ncbi:DUF1471 domain-containing protein [Escherichia coli]|uniref:DUF1471 domain-containing protein n=1 Tax=Escherichia coli TaxID=562 RepID=UPI000281D4EC|nr:DUF1471 domain-containing protein [Escherichia coli]AXV13520.1 DUF1471 domain-containing protein [Escherichia coli]EEV7801388.1 DUF1471 domain-containing protein [Escherichia coli]EEY4999776.1 DUF1471 domain-containing protein [Escherichia coli]EFA4517966.1 DUF1471 domain-containing protein [Escherichia coli]EFA6851199.1 DUF1471 domain-containing protein [Escherichia coli]